MSRVGGRMSSARRRLARRALEPLHLIRSAGMTWCGEKVSRQGWDLEKGWEWAGSGPWEVERFCPKCKERVTGWLERAPVRRVID